jgi:hypothetical protein
MSHLLTFDVSYLYEDSNDGITLPVTLTYESNQIRTYAKVDTGAEFCIFSLELGENLGIDIPSGIPKSMGSLTGTLETFGHEIVIQACGIAIQSVAYFAKYPGLPRNLLGRNGWIRKLRLGIVDYDNSIFLATYNP